MDIEFNDFSDIEDITIQFDDVLNLLSILRENVFYNDNDRLLPYEAQFVSVNSAAISQIRTLQKEILNIFNVLYKKFELQNKGG